MKRSAKVMSFVLACAVTPVIVPQASAQTQPANPGTPPAATQTPQQTPTPQQKQTQQQKNNQGTANRAKGAAAGAAIGAATTATPPPARSSELDIPVASKGGPTGRLISLKNGRVL